MWGHGYVARYFAEVTSVVFLKRYRCYKCRLVITIRPDGYWPRIRSSIANIYTALFTRLRERLWRGCSRQCGGHWLKRFVRHAKMEGALELEFFLAKSFNKGLRFLPE